MSNPITAAELYPWCKIPYDKLENNPLLKVPFRLVKDSDEMGLIMARELADEISANNSAGKVTQSHYSMRTGLLVQTIHRSDKQGKDQSEKPGCLSYG